MAPKMNHRDRKSESRCYKGRCGALPGRRSFLVRSQRRVTRRMRPAQRWSVSYGRRRSLQYPAMRRENGNDSGDSYRVDSDS